MFIVSITKRPMCYTEGNAFMTFQNVHVFFLHKCYILLAMWSIIKKYLSSLYVREHKNEWKIRNEERRAKNEERRTLNDERWTKNKEQRTKNEEWTNKLCKIQPRDNEMRKHKRTVQTMAWRKVSPRIIRKYHIPLQLF